MRAFKLASVFGTAVILLSLAAGAEIALAAKPGPGGHPGGGGGPPRGGGGPPGGGGPRIGGGGGGPPGGGAPHIAPRIGGGGPPGGGGAPHYFAPRIGGGGPPHFAPHISAGPRLAPHISAGPRFAPHIRGGRGGPTLRHFASPTRLGHLGGPTFAGGRHPHMRSTRGGPSFARTHAGTHPGRLATNHPAPNHAPPNLAGTANPHPGAIHGARLDPRNFAGRRHFADVGAFRPFLGRRWFFHHHYGWIGPLFWPYAYGDFFYDALWPEAYAEYDPFWYYGYDDIYEGIFSPHNYTEYVQGPGASERTAGLTKSAAQSCTDEADEVTGWPIDQIQSALAPDKQQTALLDALGNAVVQASNVIRAHCPTNLAFTPTERLAQMQDRLEGLVQAVNIVAPPLKRFYVSLSDEQKARFNAMGAPQGKPPAQNQQSALNPQAQCGESSQSFPTDKIDQLVRPNGAQRAKLDALVAANTKAAEMIRASCPGEPPATPPDRLATEGKHLEAMLQAVRTIRPALAAFYNALSDEQKARFNNLGQQLFAEK